MATYNLIAVQAAVANLQVAAFTTSALDGGFAVGLTTSDMLVVIQSMTAKDFYKTMESERRPGIWQDVYRVQVPSGMSFTGMLYVKVTLANGHPKVVVSFKEL